MTHCGLFVFAALACNLVPEKRICPTCKGNAVWRRFGGTVVCPDCTDGFVIMWRLPYADPEIDGPGTPCPWPFDPWLLYGAPLGQYHCPYCGTMVLAGMEHLDYADDSDLDTGD